MTKEAETLVQIGLAAAVADGQATEQEKARLREIARSRGVDASVLDATSVGLPADLAARLPSDEACEAAYELAVAVCNADGVANQAEERFLAGLRGMLGISAETAEQLRLRAAEVASVARVADVASTSPPPSTSGSTSPATGPSQLDDLILQQAKLTGALELLPQSLASMAIIPLQMRLVYTIGQSYGQTLDGGQVTDLLGTMGIGMAAQVIDDFARKIVGGVFQGALGRLLGGLVGGVAGAATGAATSFATTYALGHAARQYYAQNRNLSTDDLRALFERLKNEATELYPRVRGQIETQAQGLDVQQILRSVGKA